MRGEHLPRFTHLILDEGSSPHARGAPPPLHAPDPGRGFIPACAGSTRRRRCRAPWPRDHPRMRGEHEVEATITTYDPGSSPHARGAPVGVLDADAPAGIIPACAGSTTSTAAQTGGSRDHPRMRGEHWVAQLTRLWSGGSSPHARGALRVRRLRHRAPGIIPACAGSTRQADTGSRWPEDHPRMRGEHSETSLPRSMAMGSSPHARGAR